MPKEPSNSSEPAAARRIPAPDLPYSPRDPKAYRPGIGLIGCGGITVEHLTAYKDAGYRLVVLCDLDIARAKSRQQEFFPYADITNDPADVLAREDVGVVDIATHPPERLPLMEAAIDAGKHVLSQKPFVLDLDEGLRLIELADRRGVKLAVNQNARWAPHFSYARQAVARGLLGELSGIHFSVHWDHSWVQGTEFENVRHLILYDFAIHWFDMLTCLMGNRQPQRVFASLARSATQTVRPALLGQALVEFAGAQSTLVFDGDTQRGPTDVTYITGSLGTAISNGPSFREQQLVLHLPEGRAEPSLAGAWFPGGFHGSMGELLLAVEENREPEHSARNNLASLALCFAAVASAESHQPVVPGMVRRMPE